MSNIPSDLNVHAVNKTDIVAEIQVDDGMLRLIEKYWYELGGLTELITQFTSDSEFKPDIDRYNIVLSEYMESYIMYNVLYDQMLHEYAPEYKVNIAAAIYTTMIDFTRDSLVIINNNSSCDGGSCSCKTKK
jgi:hypothetical protein